MGRSQRVRRQPRSQTRQQVLDAAARVFARQGFHGASVDTVSEEAGFSTGAIYSNFGSKEELFLTLYEERIQRRRRELTEAVKSAGGREPGLTSAAADVGEIFERERDWFLLYFEFVLHAARSPAFARRFRVVREAGLRELAEGLTAGLEQAGVERTISPRELAQAVRALSYGLALDRLVKRDDGAEALIRRILELVFKGMSAESVSQKRARRGNDS